MRAVRFIGLHHEFQRVLSCWIRTGGKAQVLGGKYTIAQMHSNGICEGTLEENKHKTWLYHRLAVMKVTIDGDIQEGLLATVTDIEW